MGNILKELVTIFRAFYGHSPSSSYMHDNHHIERVDWLPKRNAPKGDWK